MVRRTLSPLPILDATLLPEFAKKHNIKEIAVKRLWEHLLKDRSYVASVDDAHETYTSKKLIQKLNETQEFAMLTSTVKESSRTTDPMTGRSTIKLLVELQDGALVECVIIENDGYATLCVSSQVGCKMACTFCATGSLGLSGNLLAGEICEQLVHAQRIRPIRNIVFMGMGEPLDNYKNVLGAVRLITDPRFFNLFPRHITVSTVGVVPRMKQFTRDFAGVNLALSLHAPTQDMRLKIVPTAKAWSMDKLMEALDHHILRSKKTRVMIECIVIRDINDSEEAGQLLGQLLAARPRAAKSLIINLIPYNPTLAGDSFEYEAPSVEAVDRLHDILVDEHGLHCRTRRERGQEVEAACGQLALLKGKSCGGGEKVTDIEDLVAALAIKPDPKPTLPVSSGLSKTALSAVDEEREREYHTERRDSVASTVTAASVNSLDSDVLVSSAPFDSRKPRYIRQRQRSLLTQLRNHLKKQGVDPLALVAVMLVFVSVVMMYSFS